MSGVGASLALALVLAWVVFALAGWVAPAHVAALIGAVLGFAGVFAFRDSMAIGGLVALLAPFGVMLPALALRHAGMRLGVPLEPFATWEIAAFLVAYTIFLSTAFGVIPLELYRLGYAPLPVAAMVLCVCVYGFVTGNWFLPLVAVLGQLFWVLGWGSSNWFDYVLHVLLWPVAAVVLLGRMI